MKKRNQSSLWSARWISAPWAKVNPEPEFSLAEMFGGQRAPQQPVSQRLKPAVVFERHFNVDRVQSGHLSLTAQGIYQAYLNDQPVSQALFAPDYTAYGQCLQYQTYDVTPLLHDGENTLKIVVADGWYAGRISVQGGSAQFGDQLALLAELVVIDFGGHQQIIASDEQFEIGTGKWQYADIQIGEKQDLRLTNHIEQAQAATVIDADYSRLTLQAGPQVQRQAFLNPTKIWREGDAWIVDFGQVLVGRVRLTTMLNTGQQITIAHSEVLDEAGHFFTNIVGRNKDQTDVFIGRGRVDVMEPDFTFHGFRYAKISGLAQLSAKDLVAVVIHSDLQPTGQITTSDPRINRLLTNVRWSQRGNMLSIPTDCPQRERVGWTGDMQVFAPASTFYYDTEAFIRRWLAAVRIDQQPDGEIIDYSPAPKDFYKSVEFTGSLSSAGWGDAIIMVPWTLYQRFGDVGVLQENYQAMKRWHEFAVHSAAGDKTGDARFLWDTKFHYGDWMLPSIMAATKGNPMATSEATKDVVATAFLAHHSDLLAKIADLLGDDPTPYTTYATNVRRAFTDTFVTDTGLTADYQGCYVLALAFDMVPEALKTRLVSRLVALIHANCDCLDTGFLSVPYLLDVLVDNGEADLAKKVFLQDQCPSWLYEVDQGATTIWETWAGIQPDGTVAPFSFNHYAMGCVLDWFVRKVVGLQAMAPGYQRVLIQPQVDVVKDFKVAYQTRHGQISVTKQDHQLTVSVPNAIEAEIQLPGQQSVTVVGTRSFHY